MPKSNNYPLSVDKSSSTRVGKFDVPLKRCKKLSIVLFSSGEKGKKEEGDYAFWTTVVSKKIDKKNKLIGRARLTLPAGDRVDRMRHEMLYASDKEDRKIYRKWWTGLLGKGANIKFIRPSTIKEIKRWCSSHKDDAKYIKRIIVNGRIVK